MFGNLLKKRAPTKPGRSIAAPGEAVVWAIGDVHGRHDLLVPLVGQMLADLASSTRSRRVMVFLGDYVDRGAESRSVLDTLAELSLQTEIELHFLRGNHEDRMEAFLTDPGVGPIWCDYGGRETLLSYGIQAPTARNDKDGWAHASRALFEAMGERQRAFLAGQEASFTIGDYFFAHAGAKPGIPLDQQSPYDLMWVRQSFLEDPRPFERIVVHGHTPVETVYADHRRIGVDTGAYATGVLSALRLEGEDRQVLATAKSGSGVNLTLRPL